MAILETAETVGDAQQVGLWRASPVLPARPVAGQALEVRVRGRGGHQVGHVVGMERKSGAAFSTAAAEKTSLTVHPVGPSRGAR